MNEKHHQKHLRVNQTSGTGAPSPAPHPAASLACPGQAFRGRCPAGSPVRREGGREEGKPRCWRDKVTLKLLGKNPNDLWFRGAGDARGLQRERTAGPGPAGGGQDSGTEPGATAVRRGVPSVPRWRCL